MLQKRLTQVGLSTAGATFARYIWSGPMAVVLLFAVLAVKDHAFPILNARFFVFVAFGGLFQITATLCTIALFRHRNFAVGTTFKRSETILAALVGVVILGDYLPWQGWAVLTLSLFGLVLLSKNPIEPEQGLLNRGTMLGFGSGLFFGICGVCYRGASLSLGLDDVTVAAITSVTFAIWIQVAMMLVYFAIWEEGEVMRVVKGWRIVVPVSVTSLAGSSLIFAAFTMQKVAYVNAVQQVELIFAMLGSYFFFNERFSRRELLGILIVAASIVLLILVA